ncbi:MAG TPA: branched-chain amino acid aminotransferase [Cyclobacteriaceae bacterium]|nr:branched-chain amino acid aminotransferase [Cyclobacteriaceae bacterium]
MLETLQLKVRKVEHSRVHEVDFSEIPFGKIYSDHMVVADYAGKEWKNFLILPYDHLKLMPGTSGLHYGQSIFEGLKGYKNQSGDILVFRPYENLKRMNISAKRMCMPEIPEEIFIGGIKELLNIDRNWVPPSKEISLYIRPLMFATDEYIGIKTSESYKFLIMTLPVGAYYSTSVKVKVETEYARACAGGTGFAKAAGNYAGSLFPAKLAQEQGYHQLVWTDAKEHKYIEEAGTMNLMFVIDNVLVTPETRDTILKGITRDSVMTIARDWGMKVEERRIQVDEVIEGIKNHTLTEAFGTGTAATIAPIELISYKGVDYQLPGEQARIFSKKLFDYLENYKRGRVEDKFKWMFRV